MNEEERERADESDDGEKEKRAKTNEELKDLIEKKTYERGERWKIRSDSYMLECVERPHDVQSTFYSLLCYYSWRW